MSDDRMLEEHRKTWHGFCVLMAASTAAVTVTLILMAIFLL